jgi:hypothetical protein
MNMRLSALKGLDTHLAQRLLPIVNGLGLQLRPAIVSMRIEGHYPSEECEDWNLRYQLLKGVEIGFVPKVVSCSRRSFWSMWKDVWFALRQSSAMSSRRDDA